MPQLNVEVDSDIQQVLRIRATMLRVPMTVVVSEALLTYIAFANARMLGDTDGSLRFGEELLQLDQRDVRAVLDFYDERMAHYREMERFLKDVAVKSEDSELRERAKRLLNFPAPDVHGHVWQRFHDKVLGSTLVLMVVIALALLGLLVSPWMPFGLTLLPDPWTDALALFFGLTSHTLPHTAGAHHLTAMRGALLLRHVSHLWVPAVPLP